MPHVWDPENTKLSLLAGISTIAFAWRSFTVETAVPGTGDGHPTKACNQPWPVRLCENGVNL